MIDSHRPMKRRVFLGGGVAAAVAGLTGGPAALEWRDDRQVRELSSSAASAAGGRLGQQRLIWSVATVQPLAALTFDDGPDPDLTPPILAVLAEHGVRATFNMMGRNALRHPDLVRAVVAAGPELGNQTDGVRLRFFRPPRGNLTGSAVASAAELGFDVLLWSVTRGGAGAGTPASVADHLARAVAPGDVVALHDGIGRGTFHPRDGGAQELRARRRVEVQALPAALEGLLGRGLHLVTVSALLAAEQHPAHTLTNTRRQ